MKANNGSGNNIKRDDWETPQWLFNKLKEQYRFSFDCCATWKNTKCEGYSDDFKSIPKKNIKCEIAWMNPPFSKAKEMFEHFFEIVKKGVSIYRCDNLETSLWQDIILKKADWIFIPKGRISYEGKEGTGSRFPSALIGLGMNPPKKLEGTILFIKSKDKAKE